MVSFKTLVRSISPFAGKGKGPSNSAASQDQQWDLSSTDLKLALRAFYEVYNKERVESVDEIMFQFKGEEQELLRQLCDRYGLSSIDIQKYLDRAAHPLPTKQSRSNSIRGTKQPSAKDRENDYGSFHWDCAKVDVGQALKLIYQEYNPDKRPQISKLEEKSNEDIVLLLQHLCKRHNLNQAEMQAFLDKAPKREKKPGPRPHERRSIAPLPRSDLSGTQPRSSAPDMVVTKTPSSGESETSDITTSMPSLPAPPPPPSTRMSLVPPPPPRAPAPVAAPSGGIDGGAIAPLPPSPSIRPPTAVSLPTQVPFSATPAAPQPIAPLSIHGPAAEGREGGEGGGVVEVGPMDETEEQRRQRISRQMRPVLADGKRFSMGPVLREFQDVTPPRARTASDELAYAAAGPGAGAEWRAEEGAEGGAPAEGSDMDVDLDPTTQLKAQLDQAKLELHRQRFQQQQLQQQQLQEREVAALKAELERTKQELQRASSEGAPAAAVVPIASIPVVGASGSQSTAARAAPPPPPPPPPSTPRSLSSLDSKVDVTSSAAPDATIARAVAAAVAAAEAESAERSAVDAMQIQNLRREVSQLNDIITQKEAESVAQRRRQEEAAAAQHRAEREAQREAQRRRDAETDRRDLLQLIDIMGAAPVSIAGVLDAYLQKLGEITGSTPVRSGLTDDGRQLRTGERIALALSIKRSQDRGNAHQQTQSQHSQHSSAEEKAKSTDSDSEHQSSPMRGRGGSEDYRSEGLGRSAKHLSTLEANTFANLHKGLKKSKPKKKSHKSKKADERHGGSQVESPDPSPSRQQHPGARSTGANRSRSNSPQKSKHSSGTESPSPRRNQTALIDDQYEMAKRVLLHQQSHTKLSNKLAASNLSLQELSTGLTINRTVEANKLIQQNQKQFLDRAEDTTSAQQAGAGWGGKDEGFSDAGRSGRQSGLADTTRPGTANAGAAGVDDWVECFDPRSQRRYYYSATLKKSTWKKPPTGGGGGSNSRSSSAQHTPPLTGGSRNPSPNLSPRRLLAQQQQGHGGSRYYAAGGDADSVGAGSLAGSYTGSGGDMVSLISTGSDYGSESASGGFTSSRTSRPSSGSPYSANASISTSGAGAFYDRAHTFSSATASAVGGMARGMAGAGSRSVRAASPNPRTAVTAGSGKGSRSLPASPAPSSTGGLRGGGGSTRPTSSSAARSRDRAARKPVWVTAVDPKTQRRYWYNRETKVSTWRQPAELII